MYTTTKTLLIPEMISYQQALKIIKSKAKKHGHIGSELIYTNDAQNRYLEKSISSDINVPSFDNSAMDGFALNSKYYKTNEMSFEVPVIDSIHAGDSRQLNPATTELHACEIMTGAPVPAIYDTVIPTEKVDHTFINGVKHLMFKGKFRAGDNIRLQGSDYNKGQLVCCQHTYLQPQHIMALATVGIKNVNVMKRIPVAVISTGNELAGNNEHNLKAGKIHNTNQPYISTYCQNIYCDPVYISAIKDDDTQFISSLKSAQESGAKIIISTGAVSMGKKDFIPETLKRLGANIHFHKVYIRPGKPILFAELPDGTAFFGLPGNPIAVAAGMRFFVEPYCRELIDLKAEKTISAKLLTNVSKKPGFTSFLKAHSSINESGQLCCKPLSKQGSYQSDSFAHSNSWLFLPDDIECAKQGDLVKILTLAPNQWIA